MANNKRDVPKGLPTSLTITQDRMAQLFASLSKLVESEVLVGFPEESTARDAEPGEPEGITNAALAYIHDNGSEDAKIPRREFMVPGMDSVKDTVTDRLAAAARSVLSGGTVTDVDQRLHRAGLAAQLGIQNKINDGVPPPLSDATVRKRARKGRKGAALELERRKAGEAPGMDLAKPLVDTAQMRNACKYVIRKRGET